jgi:hypothetical protein
MHEYAASVMWLSRRCSAPELLHCTLIAPTKTRSSENSGSSTRYAFEEKRMVRSLAEIKRYISQPGLALHVKSRLFPAAEMSFKLPQNDLVTLA